MGVKADVEVGREDCRHRDRGTEIGKRIHSFSIPRDRGSKSPNEIPDEVNDSRLVKTVKHVEPELEASVLETADTAHIELRKRQCGFGVEVLVESCRK